MIKITSFMLFIIHLFKFFLKKPKTILFIDDEVTLLDLYEDALCRVGYKIIKLQNTKNAYKVLKDSKVDLIVTDIMMPGQDGLEFLEEIKKHAIYKNIPVIILTNLDDKGIVNNALKLGASDYWVTSKLTKHELVLKINDFFKQQSGG